MIRLISMVLLLVPGLAGLALAILADLGPLEGSGGLLSAPRLLLLFGAAVLLAWGIFVHVKARHDEQSQGRTYLKTAMLLTVPTAISVGLAVLLAEAAAGMLPVAASGGLIFPPSSTASMQTSEFACTATINAQGIRDSEIAAEKQGLRILAIGDSFTYGWGVGDGQAWPEVLERQLRRTHPNAEVINLGAPGASPRDYALLARRAVPRLQPDLIVVAVVQGDDLAQLHYETGKSNATSLQTMLEATLPNLFGRLDQLSTAAPREITADALRAAWQAQAVAMFDTFGPEQTKRCREWEPEIRQLLGDGKINPGLLQSAIERPEWFKFTLRSKSPALDDAIANLATQLDAIRQTGEKWKAETLVVSLPLGPYTDARLVRSRERLGFEVDEAMLDSRAPDRVIEIACEQAGVPFHGCTEQFRRASRSEHLYYELDGHFNATGQARFGAFATEIVQPRLSQLTGD